MTEKPVLIPNPTLSVAELCDRLEWAGVPAVALERIRDWDRTRLALERERAPGEGEGS